MPLKPKPIDMRMSKLDICAPVKFLGDDQREDRCGQVRSVHIGERAVSESGLGGLATRPSRKEIRQF